MPAPTQPNPATWGTPPPPRVTRLPGAAESLGYAGGVLTLLGILFVTAEWWRSLSEVALALMLTLGTAVLGAGGWSVGRLAGDDLDGATAPRDVPASRLSQSLWWMTGGAAVVTSYFTVSRLADLGAEAALLAAGATAVAAAGSAWLRTRKPGLLAITFAGAQLALFGLLGLAGGGEQVQVVGLWVGALAATGAAALAPSRMRTAPVGALASVVAIGAAQTMISLATATVPTVELLAGLLTVVGLSVMAFGTAYQRLRVGFAILAAVVFVPQAGAQLLPEQFVSTSTVILPSSARPAASCIFLVRRAGTKE